jgi:hypothetical protein
LRTFLQYALFSAPAMPLAVTSNMVKVVSKKLGQAGSLENIKAWAHRTPRQRAIFGRTSLKNSFSWDLGDAAKPFF